MTSPGYRESGIENNLFAQRIHGAPIFSNLGLLDQI